MLAGNFVKANFTQATGGFTNYVKGFCVRLPPPAARLLPSWASRIANVMTWVGRLSRYCRIIAISQELVRFDTQLLQHPEIRGIEYQQGELAGYEVRAYLLEKFQHKCAYCQRTDRALQIEQ